MRAALVIALGLALVAGCGGDSEAEKKSGGSVVFDPERDATLNVTLTVSVYDFRSLEDDEKGEAK